MNPPRRSNRLENHSPQSRRSVLWMMGAGAIMGALACGSSYRSRRWRRRIANAPPPVERKSAYVAHAVAGSLGGGAFAMREIARERRLAGTETPLLHLLFGMGNKSLLLIWLPLAALTIAVLMRFD
ncbi:hypothetical protein [Planctomicrobium sp. SH664]|uniref:hypothetical protein n=1 Tax=Planctomicrobium sp. SH664 TaxID=3448125 RepID=UPI003F5C4C4F